MNDERKKPVETLRDGSVKAAIWENDGEKGKFHSVTFTRTYRDKQGNYADTNRFSGTDLLKLSSMATQSYEAVNKHRSQNYAEKQRKAAHQSQTPDKGVER